MGAIIHHRLDRAPAPVAPFSHAVETDGWVFVTGQIPENPDNEDEPLPVGIEAQTRRVMDNLKLVLSEIGLGLEGGDQADEEDRDHGGGVDAVGSPRIEVERGYRYTPRPRWISSARCSIGSTSRP